MSYVDAPMQALIRVYIACNLASEALPHLPPPVAEAVEEPLARLCDVVGEELRRVRPDLLDEPDSA